MTTTDQNHINRKADTLYCDRCQQPIIDDNYTHQNSFNFHKACPDQNRDWLDEAIIFSAKHLGAWDESMSKNLKRGRIRMLYLDLPSLKEEILARHQAAIAKAVAEAELHGRANEHHVISHILTNEDLGKLAPATAKRLKARQTELLAALTTPKERKE